MTLGMCFGLMFSNMLKSDMCLCLSIGILVGEAIGASVKKK